MEALKSFPTVVEFVTQTKTLLFPTVINNCTFKVFQLNPTTVASKDDCEHSIFLTDKWFIIVV